MKIGAVLENFCLPYIKALDAAVKIGLDGVQVLSLIHISEPTRP